MRLGDIIRNYRQLHDLSMGDFAKLSGLSKPYISMLESNKNSRDGKPIVPSIGTLLKAAKAMNITLADILNMLGENQYINLAPDISEEETTILNDYRTLNDGNKTLIKNMLSQLKLASNTNSVINVSQNVNGNKNNVVGIDIL